MNKFKSHKVVEAAKIAEISAPSDPTSNGGLILEGSEPVYPPPSYFVKHDPQVGGYYVVYEDGYASFSPAEAFESGYTPLGKTEGDAFEQMRQELRDRTLDLAEAQVAIADLQKVHEDDGGKIADLVAKLIAESGDELEKFLRSHAGAPLRIAVEARTNLVRINSVDQTQVLEGAVHGNIFQPKR